MHTYINTYTHTHTGIHTDNTHRQINTHIQNTYCLADMHTCRQTGRQGQIEATNTIQRHTYTYIHIQRQMQACWQTIRQADIHTGNKSFRQAGRAPIHSGIQTCIQADIQEGRHPIIRAHRQAGIHIYT